MFQYTEFTDEPLIPNMAVSLSVDGKLKIQDSDTAHGICVSSTLNSETDTYENVIYVAGGPGVQVKLGVEWDGKLTRCVLVDGYVLPTVSTGQGWIAPENLQAQKEEGDLVQVVLYK